MMKVMLWVIAAVTALLAGGGGVLVVGMRSGSRPVLDRVRRFNRAFTNPRVMRRAGTPGNYAVIGHTGRRSGRRYETPIDPVPTDGGYVVPLPYGTRSDWLRNVSDTVRVHRASVATRLR